MRWSGAGHWRQRTRRRALYQPGSYNDIATMWNTTWADILNQQGPVKALLDNFTHKANAMIAQDG